MTTRSPLPTGRGLAYIAFAATAWGTGGAAAAVLYDTGLDPVTVSWWRFLSGFALLAAARRWFGPATRPTRGAWPTILVTGVGLAVYQTAFYVALDLAGLAVATVVTLGAGPVLIAVGGHLTGVERLTRAGAAAVAVALAGLVLLAGTDTGTDENRLAGLGFALLSAAGYAVVTLLTRRGGRVERYDAALGGFAVGAVALTPLAAGPALAAHRPDAAGWLLLAYLAVVPTALAYVLFFAGLSVVRATTASVVALVEPVVAALMAVTLLGERLTAAAAAGAAVLLLAVLALTVAERRRPAAPRQREPVGAAAGG